VNFVSDPGLVLYLPLCELDGSSFMSRDAYGHLCTVTGALWRHKGRWFDGADDVITIPKTTVIDNIFAGGGTLIAWINPASDGEGNVAKIASKNNGWLWNVFSELTGNVKARLYVWRDGDDGYWDLDNRNITLNAWNCFAVTYNSDSVNNDPIFYINGVVAASSESGTPTDAQGDDSGDDLLLGNNAGGTNTWDGLIGEVMGYSRILTPLEIQDIYLATKWRYR